jgi:hypothetical protein
VLSVSKFPCGAADIDISVCVGKRSNDGHDKEKGYQYDVSDIWEGFSILKRGGDSTNSGNRCTSLLDSSHSDAESNAGPDLNAGRRALTMCIITTGQSLSLVDGIGFQRFVRALNLFVSVSRSTLDQDLMALYGREKDTLHSIISETPGGFSFAIDKWRSKETGDNYNDDIYLCVTACFVDAGWKLQRRIVGFKFMEFPDDVTSVAETVALCLSELKFDKKGIGITLDNDTLNNIEYEASMPDSLKTVLHDKCKLLWDGEFCQVHCLTDILNSVVQASLGLISDIISKIRHGIHHITYSASTLDAFYRFAKDICHLGVMKLRADLVVTWDSTYKMLGCAIHYRDAFTHFASTDETLLSEYHLSDDEWNKVAIVEKFLKPIYDITCIFIRTEFKTSNLYFLGVYKVYRLLEVTKERDNFMSAMVKDIKVKFDKYWVECSPILACAAVLDPRYKLNLVRYCFRKVYGEADSAQHVDRVVALLHRLLAEYEKSSCLSLVGTNVVEYHAKDDLFDDYPPQEQISELDWYLQLPTMDLNTDLDILEFWSVMSKCYPDLASLARDILAVPISTVASKSAFNTQEKILNPHRGSTLSPDLLEMLICLHDWTCPKDKNGIVTLSFFLCNTKTHLFTYFGRDEYDIFASVKICRNFSICCRRVL